MTYKQLAEVIGKMSEKQQNYHVMIYDLIKQQCFQAFSVQPIPDEEVFGFIPAEDNPVITI